MNHTAGAAPSAGTAHDQLPGAWMPRHAGREAASGCVWLPRLIDKGRRVLEGDAAGRDLLGDYLFGVNDAADTQLLRFLRLTNEDVLAVLRRHPDDAGAAAELVRRSGRTPAECAAWSARFLRFNAPFLAMMDADEGRRAPGAGTTALRLAYNRVIMPPAYAAYRWAERRRLRGTALPRRWAAVALSLGAALLAVAVSRRTHAPQRSGVRRVAPNMRGTRG